MAHPPATAVLPAPWARLTASRHSTSRVNLGRRTPAAAAAPERSAQAAGLRYVNDTRLAGIRRIGKDRRFRYVDPHGRTVSDPEVLQRIKSLVIPPAWTDVWI